MAGKIVKPSTDETLDHLQEKIQDLAAEVETQRLFIMRLLDRLITQEILDKDEFLEMYAECQPYTRDMDDWLAERVRQQIERESQWLLRVLDR